MLYTELKEKVEKKECQLKWTEDVFNETFKNYKTNIDIISKCGHETKVQCSNFLYCNSGVTCKQCLHQKNSEAVKGITTNNLLQEYHVMKAFQKYLQGKLELRIMVEGSLADFAIKPCSIVDDLWLPVQLKSTLKICHGLYSFTMHNNIYNDMFVMLFVVENQKTWIINSSDINVSSKINIGKYNSVYSKYEVKVNDINQRLTTLYCDYKHYLKSFETINVPVSEQSKNAIEMNRYRESLFPTFSIKYPEMGGTVYDSIINETYKVQDKVASCYSKKKTSNSKEYRSTKTYSVHLSRYRTNTNLAYKLGDNDYYWIHLPDKKGAYIIHEKVLLEHGLISSNDIDNCISLFPYHTPEELKKYKRRHTWLNDHLYFYDKDIDKVIKLFDPTGREPYIDTYECPIVIGN
jgi:hypothetical protein